MVYIHNEMNTMLNIILNNCVHMYVYLKIFT